jgi:hypothetical protein
MIKIYHIICGLSNFDNSGRSKIPVFTDTVNCPEFSQATKKEQKIKDPLCLWKGGFYLALVVKCYLIP